MKLHDAVRVVQDAWLHVTRELSVLRDDAANARELLFAIAYVMGGTLLLAHAACGDADDALVAREWIRYTHTHAHSANTA